MLDSLSHALKLFLPSWNFFDDFSTTPRLLYRVRCNEESPPSEWRLLYSQFHTASLLRAFYNPFGNAELFELALIETAADAWKIAVSNEGDESLKSDVNARLLACVRNRAQQIEPPSFSKNAAVQYQLWFASNGTAINAKFESIWHPLVDTPQ